MMNNSALVTVIIPTYRRTTELSRLLDCLTQQTVKAYATIIVDNAGLNETFSVGEEQRGGVFGVGGESRLWCGHN